jgi:hypothetical protein
VRDPQTPPHTRTFTEAWQPWHVVAAVLCLYLGIVLSNGGYDPLVFVRLGHGPNQGYDGQFTYLIASDPDPDVVIREIGGVRSDVPAYRYQRILLPILARVSGAGRAELIAWTIPLINTAAQIAGTALVTRLLAALSVSRWYALVYGLWPGLLLGVRADLTEPLSCALVAGAYLSHAHRRTWLSALCFALAVFAKETALLFAAAQVAYGLLARQWAFATRHALVVLLPFAIWQIALARWFGAFGLGTGGYLGTPLEVVPFAGLFRIAADSVPLFAAFLVVYGPAVVWPTLWGLAASLRDVLHRQWHPYALALGGHAALIPFTPFSTFREPGAMLRFVSGLVLATLLFGALRQRTLVLRRTWFWLTLLVFLRE